MVQSEGCIIPESVLTNEKILLYLYKVKFINAVRF